MIRFLSTLVLLTITIFAQAQPGVAPVKVIDGKNYYIHTVEPGNTLFGLQRMYDCPMEEIVKANSGELEGGLKVGQQVKIPVKSSSENSITTEQKTSSYKIKGGETLYGISRKFGTTVDELIRLNPGVENGIQKGQVIVVPGESSEEEEEEDVVETTTTNPFVVEEDNNEAIEVVFQDSIVQHKVLQHETMYSISKRYMVSVEEIMEMNNLRSTNLSEGQVLKIAIKQERIEKVGIKEVPPAYDPNGSGELVFDRKKQYKIVVLAPFYLDYGTGYSEYVSNMATQFYMGAQMAIDTLRSKGFKAEVHFIDTKNDSTYVVKLLSGAEFKNADVIIGPFFPKTQKIVANFCKENKIRMILPVTAPQNLLNDNRLVYSTVPSDVDLMQSTAKHLAEKEKGANIILIQVNKEKDKELYNAFKENYNAIAKSTGAPALRETTIENVKNLIVRGSKNIFVVPTNDKNTAMSFMNTLNKSAFRSSANDLVIYGTKDWMNFSDVNGIYREKFNFHFLSNTYLNYNDKYIIGVNRNFRKKYNTDLSRMAAQGYDIMLYTGETMLMERQTPHLIMNKFDFIQKGKSGALINMSYFVLEQEEFELIDTQSVVNGER